MVRRLLAVAILALLASGAAVAASGMPAKHVTAAPTPSPTPKRTTPPTRRPRPVRTVIVSGPTLQAGQSGVVGNPAQGMSLRLTATRPTTSRTRLSSSYGYPPEHGYYVTFSMTVVNHGTQTLQIGPLDFFVQVAGARKTTTEDGAAPYSGASAQFDNTFLDPGESYTAPLTFDVPTPHGLLSYAPDSSPALSWRF